MDDWGETIPHRPAELSYVKTVPLPISTDENRKSLIRTRCISAKSITTILEHKNPTREQVRKENYDRRLAQQSCEGFVSLKQKPYRAIGDPVYLNTKHLISDALGLAYHDDEDILVDRADTPTLSELHENNKDGKRESAQAVLIRRSKRKLNTLRKELDRGRGLLRNVRLGHGLFKVLQDEWTKTTSRRELEAALEKQRSMMDWQMARSDDDSDSCSDDELNENEDLTKYIVQLDIPDYAAQYEEETADQQIEDRVKFNVRPETHNGMASNTDRTKEMAIRQKSAPVTRQSRHRGHPPRPYTPLHNNISYQRKHHTNQVVGGDDMGGVELNKKEVDDKQQKEQLKYDNMFKVPKQKESKRYRPRAEKKRSTAFIYQRNIRSRSGSIAPSLASSEAPFTPVAENPFAGLDDHPAELDSLQEDKSVESYQNQVQEVNATNGNRVEERTMTGSSRRPANKQTTLSQTRTSQTDGSGLQLTREELKEQELARQLEEVAKMDSTPMERLSHSRMYRATDKMKPKSSRELLEFKASCRSSQLLYKSADLKQSWGEVKEERALRLHDQLDYHDKYRLQTCRNKFSAMSTTSNSLHRALKEMRLKNEYKRREDEKERNKKQDQSKYAKWFDDLTKMIPEDHSRLWYITAIMDKLRLYGITESSSKASESKFTRALKLIRPWEICSPNIAAAVEFCRDRVIEMNEEEFEPIFQHIFPAVERPKTAPPTTSNSHSPANRPS